MKLDYNSIIRIEEERGLVSLLRLKELDAYLQLKIRKTRKDAIQYISVDTVRGKPHLHPFVSKELVEQLKVKKSSVDKKKRTAIGRPYIFCKGCEHFGVCSADISCSLRDEYNKKKEQVRSVSEDVRFWKNGTPKKNLILCQYAKYKYAHKKTAGQCQKEKCAFYSEQGCFLGIDKA